MRTWPHSLHTGLIRALQFCNGAVILVCGFKDYTLCHGEADEEKPAENAPLDSLSGETMNIKKLTMTVALGTLMTAASAGAMASNMGFDQTGTQWLENVSTTNSTLTRADVKNEVIMARQQGNLKFSNTAYPVAAKTQSASRSRAAVHEEAIQSVQNGRVSDLYIGG
jgi:hypothetical protein